jgi:UDP-N-acetylmuramate--alanine ligase
MELAFLQFAGNMKENGLLLTKKGLKRENDFNVPHHLSYAVHDLAADIHVASLKIQDGAYQYDVIGPDWQLKNIQLNMGGMHNVENSLVAIAIAKHLNIQDEKIIAAVENFKGVKRRFEYILRTGKNIYIDDYAHHPEELRMLLSSVKELYPEKKLTIIFQPHLYTRTRDLVDGFAESLDLADEAWLLPIYPARELPIEGVSSSMIADRMKKAARLVDAKEISALLGSAKPDLLITAGAGDIDKMVEPIKQIMLSA